MTGLYIYKFEGLPDHKKVSFRTHFTARLKKGKLIQPDDVDKAYHWVPVKEAMEKITFKSLKSETTQILKYPKEVWEVSFRLFGKVMNSWVQRSLNNHIH